MSEHSILVLVVRMAAGIMCIHTQIVTETMREESYTRSSLQNILFFALKNTQLEESFDCNSVCFEVNIVPHYTLLEHVGADMLHLEDNIVDCSTFRAKFASDREGSCLGRS